VNPPDPRKSAFYFFTEERMIEAIAIIPARYGSKRFPGKVLADLHGKPVVQHVYERVSCAKSVSQVIIATR